MSNAHEEILRTRLLKTINKAVIGERYSSVEEFANENLVPVLSQDVKFNFIKVNNVLSAFLDSWDWKTFRRSELHVKYSSFKHDLLLCGEDRTLVVTVFSGIRTILFVMIDYPVLSIPAVSGFIYKAKGAVLTIKDKFTIMPAKTFVDLFLGTVNPDAMQKNDSEEG